ncbi:MAG TPA: (2Fe-2S)-binding protein [Vicinamibacteria bacterium]|jgi:xanthine dehydrogenase YagT iron-sulfur-binding subunit|nr:(2Fe-2S)-binding protein [Vicinamibacteria bacterium]
MRKPPSREDENPSPGFSRRAFLKTAGVGAAATGLVGVESRPLGATVLGREAAPLSLKVNGSLRTVTVEPRVTLLNALRNHLDLTGAKQVCDRGSCGACTVLLDGEPVCSCLMLAADAAGHEITTVEGLGTPEKMSPLQAAFVESDALQCGFCTPGFVVAGTALLSHNPDPSLEQVKDGLAGNLCRCGTYGRVFEAVQKAARVQAAARKKG